MKDLSRKLRLHIKITDFTHDSQFRKCPPEGTFHEFHVFSWDLVLPVDELNKNAEMIHLIIH